jgi:hypothetical protein
MRRYLWTVPNADSHAHAGTRTGSNADTYTVTDAGSYTFTRAGTCTVCADDEFSSGLQR